VSEPNSGDYPVAPKAEGSAAKSDKTATPAGRATQSTPVKPEAKP